MEEKKIQEASKEELQRALMDMTSKCQELYGQLQQANMFNTFKHLDYCYKFLEHKDLFDPSLVEKVKTTICEIMFNEDDRD